MHDIRFNIKITSKDTKWTRRIEFSFIYYVSKWNSLREVSLDSIVKLLFRNLIYIEIENNIYKFSKDAIASREISSDNIDELFTKITTIKLLVLRQTIIYLTNYSNRNTIALNASLYNSINQLKQDRLFIFEQLVKIYS